MKKIMRTMKFFLFLCLLLILLLASCDRYSYPIDVKYKEDCCNQCLENFSQYPGAQGPEAVYCSQIVTEGSCAEEFNIKDITVQNCLEKN